MTSGFPPLQCPSKRMSTLKGKDFLLGGKFFSLRVYPFLGGRQTLDKLRPLKVYPFSLSPYSEWFSLSPTTRMRKTEKGLPRK